MLAVLSRLAADSSADSASRCAALRMLGTWAGEGALENGAIEGMQDEESNPKVERDAVAEEVVAAALQLSVSHDPGLRCACLRR